MAMIRRIALALGGLIALLMVTGLFYEPDPAPLRLATTARR